MPAAKLKKPSKKKAVLVIFPDALVRDLDAIVEAQDTDRSKFIRRAVRNAMRQPA
jgi:metal-responsive CopG/Arc/MetJ family transcriptional regulator